MATDATGTPTSLGIPKYNTAVDAPSGKGFNAAMDSIDTLVGNRITKPGSPSANNVLVWNGSAWVAQTIADASISAGAAINGTKLGSGTVTGTQLASGVALAGAPTTTTAAVDDNSTKIATTLYVANQAAAATPLAENIGAGVVGTATRFARADHRHPPAPSIYDTSGSASRLNPYMLGAIMNSGDINLPGTAALGDGVLYDLIQGGMASADANNDRDMILVDFDGLNAAGGTLQWRCVFNFSQAGGAQGGSAWIASLSYRLWNLTSGGVAAPATFPNLNAKSYTDSNGTKTFDSGFQTTPVSTGLYGISFAVTTSRTGGVNREIQRIFLSLQARNV